MSSYFRDAPRLADRLRGKSGDELLQEIELHLAKDNDGLFEPVNRHSRDPFGRHASAFSRGFPFDDDDDYDDSFGRRGDSGIRAHLNDLASRHPELAQHLFGPPWSDATFHNSPLRHRRRRRGSGSSNSGGQQQHGHQVDEDAHSQASGSSAASGASAVSSHSGDEPDTTASVPPSSSIPHYGLRNTVDIGQQQRRENVDRNMEKNERGQRSMSAPPENRQQQAEQQPQQQSQPAGQPARFVSRVDITPQHNKQQQQRAQSPKSTPPPQQHSTSNVRHIPIFVEGRDEPVIPRVKDDTPPPQPPPPSSSSFQRQASPPHFHRPSYFNDHHHFGRQQWPPSNYQEVPFYETSFEQPTMRRHQPSFFQQQPQYHQQHQQPQYYQQQQPQQSQYHHQQQQHQPQYHQQQQQQQQYHQQQPQQQQQQPQQEMPKPKPPVPKDPLDKVAQVQKDVDDLAEQVRRFVGGSRQDKEYVYLDEMLTRELIKLDDIETEGRENVRQARKNAIKSIQDTISLLETKAPLAGQQERSLEEKGRERAGTEQREETPLRAESMEIDTKQEKKQNCEPIPLPPAPSSPTKIKTESSGSDSNVAKTVIEAMDQSAASTKQDNERTDMVTDPKIEDQKNMEQRPVTSTDESQRAEGTTTEEGRSSDGKNANDATQTAENDAMKTAAAAATVEEKSSKEGEGKTQTNVQNHTESPRLQKKTKKTKKQQQQQQSSPPVSEQAIPLPPPPPTESAK